jgi:hypothetical protein
MSLSLDIDTDDEENNKICIIDDKSEYEAQQKINKIENKNKSLGVCNNVCKEKENKYGATGTICTTEDKKILKMSNMPEKIMNTISKPTTLCSNLVDNIDIFENENNNTLKYSELHDIFPNNIMKVYNTTQCKITGEKYYYNNQYIEKIDGILLKTFLENNNDDTKKLQIMFQLFYILIYANMHGYYHNDLKFDNIILKECNKTVIYDNIITDKNKISLSLKNNFYYACLIDFSYSIYAPTNKIGMYNIIEAIHLLNLFKNYFTNNKKIIELINNIKNLSGDFNNFIISGDTSGRLLSRKYIENDDGKISQEKILQIFKLIEQMNSNSVIISIDDIDNESDNYYEKYLKYKKKYLELKYVKK